MTCLAPEISAHSAYQNRKCRCDRCRTAKAEYNRAYRSRPEAAEQRRTKQRQRYWRHKRIINTIKEAIGCVDCGVRDWRVIDFDHKDPTSKTAGLAEMARHGGSFKWLMDEIEKCEPRCANCHRIKTIGEK